MHWLNYHHLLYFWTMAREGSVSKAAELLHLSQPTVSGQLRQLERSLGNKLYQRNGNSILLTEAGRVVFEYAEKIFTTGQELVRTLQVGGPGHRPHLAIGIPDFLSKSIVSRLLQPLFCLANSPLISCREGELDELLGDLALHRVDMVLSDSAVGSQFKISAASHHLGQSNVVWMAAPQLAGQLAGDFPQSLCGQPLIVPTTNTVLRQSIEQWLEQQSFAPHIVAEIEDSGLMETLGSRLGHLVPVPSVAIDEVRQRYGLEVVGTLADVTMQFFLIVGEKQHAEGTTKNMISAAQQWLTTPKDTP